MHNRGMERDWKRLATAIKTAREAAGMTQRDLAEKAGIAVGSVQNLESGQARARMPQSLAKIEKALSWAGGSGVAILDGASGPVLISNEGDGHYIAKIPLDELSDAITSSAIAVTDNLTAREIRELSKAIIDELNGRGLL
jgi:transcriptional regulator with XRE-family HTH domain